jgi:hypothetical protein
VEQTTPEATPTATAVVLDFEPKVLTKMAEFLLEFDTWPKTTQTFYLARLKARRKN